MNLESSSFLFISFSSSSYFFFLFLFSTFFNLFFFSFFSCSPTFFLNSVLFFWHCTHLAEVVVCVLERWCVGGCVGGCVRWCVGG